MPPAAAPTAAGASSSSPSLLHVSLTRLAAILALFLLAVVLRWLLHRALSRLVNRTAHGLPALPARLRAKTPEALLELSPVASERRQQRAETVGSVLRNVVSVFVFGIAFVEALDVLGVNLAPIVASAGIVGVAVGFGAQNLVRDFISGLLMILEDQYGVGDVIDVGPATGTVESVGLRITRLRDVYGVVWHIRNGEITRVGNKSQGWSRALLDIPVAYSQDLDRARQVIKAAADSVWADPDFAERVLEEPEVWGVETFSADGMVVRLVVKTSPLDQWDVARELRARIKAAFDAAGVEIPLPQRSVWLRTPAAGAPAPTHPDHG